MTTMADATYPLPPDASEIPTKPPSNILDEPLPLPPASPDESRPVNWHERYAEARASLTERQSHLRNTTKEVQSLRAAIKKLHTQRTKRQQTNSEAVAACAQALHDAKIRYTAAQERKTRFERRQAALKSNYDKLFEKAQEMKRKEENMENEADTIQSEREKQSAAICERVEELRKTLQEAQEAHRTRSVSAANAVEDNLRIPLQACIELLEKHRQSGHASDFTEKSLRSLRDIVDIPANVDLSVLQRIEACVEAETSRATAYQSVCREQLEGIAAESEETINGLFDAQAQLEQIAARTEFLTNLFGKAA